MSAKAARRFTCLSFAAGNVTLTCLLWVTPFQCLSAAVVRGWGHSGPYRRVGFMPWVLRRWGWWVFSTLFLRLVWKGLRYTNYRLYLRAPETVWEVISVKGSVLAPSLSICRTLTIRECFQQSEGTEHVHYPRVLGSLWLCGAEAGSLLPSPRPTTFQMGDQAASLPQFSSSIEWGSQAHRVVLVNEIVPATEAVCPKPLRILLGVK